MSKKEWFRDWFESEDYLLIYKHRNKAEASALVDLVLRNTDLKPGQRVLDLACGFGRHSILFGEKGFNVTGLDLSSTLLKIAKSDAGWHGVQISLVRGDIRKRVFRSGFDLVTNFFTSWGYFSDHENFTIFHLISEYLNSGGYFVFDYFNRNYLQGNLVPESDEIVNGVRIIQKRLLSGDFVKKQISIIKTDTEIEFEESVRLYDSEVIENNLISSGFSIRQKFGNYNGQQYDFVNSPRLILICQKDI